MSYYLSADGDSGNGGGDSGNGGGEASQDSIQESIDVAPN